jgi:signal transduction histidine kinase
LKQVIVNLLDNAIKFTLPGGRIELTTRRANGTAILEVADNGIGIPEGALPRVFDRFFRVDKARSREQGGAGIGLSIVRSIVLAHGGEVRVEPNQPSGSRFVVQLLQKTETTPAKPSR